MINLQRIAPGKMEARSIRRATKPILRAKFQRGKNQVRRATPLKGRVSGPFLLTPRPYPAFDAGSIQSVAILSSQAGIFDSSGGGLVTNTISSTPASR